jgi:hypothetical protein
LSTYRKSFSIIFRKSCNPSGKLSAILWILYYKGTGILMNFEQGTPNREVKQSFRPTGRNLARESFTRQSLLLHSEFDIRYSAVFYISNVEVKQHHGYRINRG